jgi:hypothetical protein
MSKPWSRAAAILAALITMIAAGFGLGIAVDDNGDGQPDRYIVKVAPPALVTAAVGVDGPDRDAKPDTALKLDRPAREIVQRVTANPAGFDFAGNLRGPDNTPVAENDGPLATPNFPGCTTRILPTNWSNRTASVRAIALHYTAGANAPGLADMNGLTGFASSPAAGVSWHFLIDAEGHCYYQVPLEKKAWAIASLNSQTVNIEVIGTGKEATYPASPAGAAKLRDVVRRIASIYKLPLRLGATDGHCNVTVTGIITHWMGGLCSGGHVDIKPFDITAVVRWIAAGASSSTSSASGAKLTASEAAHIKTLVAERRSAKRHGGWDKIDARHLRNATAAKKWLCDRAARLRRLKTTAGRTARIGALEAAIR